jgi:hypothetical protein
VSLRSVVVAAATVGVGLLVFVLVRGEEPSAQLRALEADPLAVYVPQGGTLVDTSSQNEDTTFGKPISARLSRTFELAPGTAERSLQDARAAATAAGWVPLPPSSAFPNVVVASKRVPSGRIELGVTVLDDARVAARGMRPPALLVSLRHLGP